MENLKQWYPIEFAGTWMILDEPFYEGKDVMNAENVGEIRAEKNAQLVASAPDLLEALIEIIDGKNRGVSGRLIINEGLENKIINAIHKAIK
jgi:hypothetical protein